MGFNKTTINCPWWNEEIHLHNNLSRLTLRLMLSAVLLNSTSLHKTFTLQVSRKNSPLFWNSNIHHRRHKSLSLDHEPVHILYLGFPKYFLFIFPDQNCVCISFPHSCHDTSPLRSHRWSPWQHKMKSKLLIRLSCNFLHYCVTSSSRTRKFSASNTKTCQWTWPWASDLSS